jgi:hypothetical protein
MTLSKCFVSSVALGIAIASTHASAQGDQVAVGPSAKAKSLSGIVRRPDGTALPGVSITLFDCGDGIFHGKLQFRAEATTSADSKGHFELKWPLLPRVCLQFQAPGVDTMQMEVLRAQDAGKLDVKLASGT